MILSNTILLFLDLEYRNDGLRNNTERVALSPIRQANNEKAEMNEKLSI